MSATPPLDTHQRTIDYLRISVTDRCNERCLYCMPEGYTGWALRPDHLTGAEIVRAAAAAAALGFRKFRLTGGEPLLRPDLVAIAEALWNLPGVETLGLSTNGTRLAKLAGPLRRAGIRSVNVSLDALDPRVYREVTGGRVEDVLAGIDAALEAGFERVKLNCVLMRGVTETELGPLVDLAARLGTPLRFIELMPLSDGDVLDPKRFLPVGEAMRLLREREGALEPAPETRIGHGPAAYYRAGRSGALVGFIGAMTNLHFCDACNKLRLTADGKLRPCLGRHGEIDLAPALRSGSDEAVRGGLPRGAPAETARPRIPRGLRAGPPDGRGGGMTMEVVLFSHLRDAAGTDRLLLDAAGPLDADALWLRIVEQAPALAKYRPSVRIARNAAYLEPGEEVGPGDEIALIPPVSGG